MARAQTGPGATRPAAISLEQAVQLALANNQSLRAQRLSIDQARAGKTTAALKPNPVYTNVNEDFQIFSPSQLTWENLTQSREYLHSLTYMIERGGKREKRMQVEEQSNRYVGKVGAKRQRAPAGDDLGARDPSAFLDHGGAFGGGETSALQAS